ncbi:putative beta-N-acetylglucosaminidase [Phyllosticta capitalensis]|uniref:glycoside hydrolase family 3 protein n=1 Tax=Phyllosticta capitalensis TaxID=121624 RepID=UPI00312E9B47
MAAASQVQDKLRRQIGSLFIVGFHGQTVDQDIKKLIRAPYYVGQIVLFQRNVANATQLAQLTHDLQEVAKEAGHEHPLIIGIDQENGLVTRIAPPITPQLPGSMTLGATGASEDAYNVGKATGRVLRSLGINMNYGPVCDVNNNPSNPVIGVRSFGDDPTKVADLAAANLRGLRDGGIISCAKHFPGHGDTAVDSHYGLPKIEKTWEQLERCEVVPFKRAVENNIESVMTAHIVFGDSSLPATLDPKVLSKLRSNLNYQGVIISDCLEMNAIRTECGGTVQGAVTALKAGCDCVMICHTIALQSGALDAVYAAAEDSSFAEQLTTSHRRVNGTRQDLSLEAACSKPDLQSFYHISAENAKLALDVYKRSATLVRGSKILPLKKDGNMLFILPADMPIPSGVVEYGDLQAPVPETPSGYLEVLKSFNPHIQTMKFFENGSNDKEILDAAAATDTVILATRNARFSPYQRKMARALQAAAPALVVIATCDPYDFLGEDGAFVENYVAIYEPTAAAFQGAADVLFGVCEARGRLPVRAP